MTKLHDEATVIIDGISREFPKVAYNLLKGYQDLADLGCAEGETLESKTDKLNKADDICEAELVKVVKCAAEIVRLKDMIKAANMMRCGG